MLSLADAPSKQPTDAIALVHGGQRWSWGEFDRRSAASASHLKQAGVGADDLVAFAFPNGPEFLALTFGIYRAGATPAPLSAKLPLSEREAILTLMRPAAFLDASQIGAEWAGPPNEPAPIARSWKASTSGGSTGRPKVIVDGLPAGFAEGLQFIGIPERGVVYVPGPLYHNGPFSAAVFSLWRGSTVMTADRFDPLAALETIAREKVEWSMMVPTMMHRLMRIPEATRRGFDLSSWKMVVHTAAAMAPWLKRAWIDAFGPDRIWKAYGATEGLVRR